jgi:hypothetical protein
MRNGYQRDDTYDEWGMLAEACWKRKKTAEFLDREQDLGGVDVGFVFNGLV